MHKHIALIFGSRYRQSYLNYYDSLKYKYMQILDANKSSCDLDHGMFYPIILSDI